MEASKPHPKLDNSYFGYFYGMGSGTHSDSNPHALTWRLPSVTENFISLYENHGVNICIRHRPFGETQGGPMDWDQAVTIKNDEEWNWLIDQYHEETIKLIEKCPNAIIIDYIGKIENQLMERYNSGQYSQLLHRLWGGVQPMMNHKVWIGYDAASGSSYPDGSVFHHFCEAVTDLKRHQGCDTLVEAIPAIEDIPGGITTSPKWTQDQHALCLEIFYQNRIKRFPTQFRWKSETKNTFRVANGHSKAAWDIMKKNGMNPIDDWVNSCFENKHTPVWAMPTYNVEEFISKWKAIISE